MEAINEFYKDILNVLDLEVDSNGGIWLKAGKGRLPLTINGLPAVLPTADNIKNIIDTDGEKPVAKYFLFNPGHEDPIRKNTSLQKLREIIYRKLENKLTALIEALSILGLENSSNSIGMEEFIELVLRFKNKTIKKLFDDQVVNAIRDIYSVSKKSANPKLNLLHIFLNKGGKIGNERYNKIANIAFPIYETLINDFNVKKDTIEGIKLRNKDKGIILSAYEFIIKNPDDLTNGITIGSKNKVSPGLHTMLIILDTMIDKINNAVESIKEDLDEETINSLSMRKLNININELNDFLEGLKGDLEFIPNEKDIEALIKQGVGAVGISYREPVRNNLNQQQTVTQEQQQYDPLEAGLNSDMVNPGYAQPQQPVMMQQPIMTPPPTVHQQYDPLEAGLMRGF